MAVMGWPSQYNCSAWTCRGVKTAGRPLGRLLEQLAHRVNVAEGARTESPARQSLYARQADQR